MDEAPPRRALDDVVAQVGAARPRLIDRWEAAALLESLGYTDARVRRELGFHNTLALASYVFDALVHRRGQPVPAPDPERMRPLRDVLRSAAATWVYALPWLLAVAIDRAYPSLLRLPDAAVPPLTLALLCSLIVSGGFVQALSRLGRYYAGIEQPRVGAAVCAFVLRAGVVTTVMVAVVGAAFGWYSGVYSWPYLVLAADQFIVLSVSWMAFAVLTIRDAYWRVPLAFAAGATAFLLVRAAGADALTAQLFATGGVLITALAQMRATLAGRSAPSAPLLRMSVLMYGVLPYFCYGLFYFAFLCSNGAAGFGWDARLPRGQALGLSLALMTFLLGSAAIEYANLRFMRLLRERTREPSDRTGKSIAAAARRLWRRSLATTLAGYLVVSVVVAAAGIWVLRVEPRAVLPTLLFADAGYLLLALGALNALILFTLTAPWSAVIALAGGFGVALATRFVTADATQAPAAVMALMAGALFVAVWSTRAVHDRLRHADYAIARS